jgi:hypothetical protein
LLDPEGRSGKHPKEERREEKPEQRYKAKALNKSTLPLERRPS